MRKFKRIIFRILGAMSLFISFNILTYIRDEKSIPQAAGIPLFLIAGMILTFEAYIDFLQVKDDIEEPIAYHIIGGSIVALIDILALIYAIGVIIKYSTNIGTVIAFLALVLSVVIGVVLIWIPRFINVTISDNRND